MGASNRLKDRPPQTVALDRPRALVQARCVPGSHPRPLPAASYRVRLPCVLLSQSQATDELQRWHREYQGLLDSAADADWERPGTIGDGDWSLRDLVGHILSWEELALQAISAVAAGDPPADSGQGIDQLNQEMVERKAAIPLADLRRQAAATHAVLIQTIADLADDIWARPVDNGDEGPMALGEMLGGVLGAEHQPFGHISAHLGDLRHYVADTPV